MVTDQAIQLLLSEVLRYNLPVRLSVAARVFGDLSGATLELARDAAREAAARRLITLDDDLRIWTVSEAGLLVAGG